MADIRWTPRWTAAMLVSAIALIGCLEQPYDPATATRAKGPRLAMPTQITPPVRVEAVRGAPEQWDMNERVAAALRARDIPASVGAGGRVFTMWKFRCRSIR